MSDFLYPNLLSGTRTGEGWTRVAGTGGYNPDTGIELYNSKSGECYLHSTNVTLKHGVKYSISFDTVNTANTAGVDMYVLYDDSTASGWIARERAAIQKGPGGVTSRTPSSFRARPRKASTISASTTTALRTAACLWSGSATSCSASPTCRMRGLPDRTMIGADEE